MAQQVIITKPSELAVSLVFDEMAIRKHFDYSQALDRIDGLVAKGEVANQAVVLMTGGVASKWKQVSSLVSFSTA